MIKRRKPLTRGKKPIERSPLKRGTTPIPKEGPVGKRKRKAREQAKSYYFKNHGKNGLAKCQWCREEMTKADANAHHKKPRGEGGSDELENMVVVHERCHIKVIHYNVPGRPHQPQAAAERFALVETCEANAKNGLFISTPEYLA